MSAEHPTPPAAAPGPPDQRTRTIPREQDAPRALIVLMIVLLLGSVVGAYYGIERAGIAEQVMGRPEPLVGTGMLLDLEEIVREQVKANLVGRDVALWGATVQRVSGDWLFWIGPDSAAAVPVVLLGEQAARQPESETTVQRGDTLAVYGTVQAIRDASLLDERSDTRPHERAHLERAGVYISALRVEVVGRAE